MTSDRNRPSLKVVQGGPPGADDERPTIEIVPGQLPAIVDAAEAALALADHRVYQMGGVLVRPAESGELGAESGDGVERPAGAPRLIMLGAVALRDILTRAIRWTKFDGRRGAQVEIDCPMAVAHALVERRQWPRLPELTGYVEAATVRPDGSVIATRGYDRRTGLYVTRDACIPTTIPSADALSRDAALTAAERIYDVYDTFPFRAEEDRAAAVAAVMTFLYARALPAVPLVAVTATAPGTGKTMLIDGCAIVATGRPCAVMAPGSDGAELEKRLAAALLAGDSPLSLDNMERPLHGEVLCQAISQTALSVRPLGGSAIVRAPSRVALAATGNNLILRGDLNRRVMLIRLDAQVEHPEQRRFGGRDHLVEMAAARPQLIEAALTITASYVAAGYPDVECPPLGGFGQWDGLVRRPLIWAGYPDPLAPAAAGRDDDPDRAAMIALLAAWHERYGDQAVTAAEVVADAVRGTPRFEGGGTDLESPGLHEAVAQAAADRGNRITARRLGYALRRWHGRIGDGMRLQRAGAHNAANVMAWKVVEVDPGDR